MLIPIETSLGDYEQRVLLELDTILTWPEASSFLAKRGFRLMVCTVRNSYDQSLTVTECVNKILLIISCYSEWPSIDATD